MMLLLSTPEVEIEITERFLDNLVDVKDHRVSTQQQKEQVDSLKQKASGDSQQE